VAEPNGIAPPARSLSVWGNFDGAGYWSFGASA